METPLLKALAAHQERQSYHTPGHKNGCCLPQGLAHWQRAVFADDVTEITGFDNLQAPKDTLKKSMQAVARAYGAQAARYLAGGTTLGLLAAIYAFAPKGKVLMPRHAHRSVYHGLCLAGAQGLYVPSLLDDVLKVPVGMDEESFVTLLQKEKPQIALFVRPTYHGYVQKADAALIKLAKAQGAVTVVDAAHGAHFAFHEAYPKDALALGADITVMSIHKTMPALTQGSVALINDAALVPAYDRTLQLLQSTSPSYLVLASMEAAIATLASATSEMFTAGMVAVEKVARQIAKLQHIHLAQPQKAVTQDPLRLYVRNDKITGDEFAVHLENRGIDVEMADRQGVLLLFPWQDCMNHEPLLEALAAIDKTLAPLATKKSLPPAYIKTMPNVAISIHEALFAHTKVVPLADAIGKVSGDFLQVYPPGIPLVVPGEIISHEMVTLLKDVYKAVDIIAEEGKKR